MKKIFALLLSLALMLSCAAMAEGAEKTAAVMELSNIEVSDGSQTQNLGDLAVSAILDAASDPTFVLTADDGTDYLAALAAKITTDGKLAVMVSGVDATYTGDIAALAQQSGTDASTIAQFTEALPQLPAVMKDLIPVLDSLVLPPFSGVAIPKLDVSALLAGFVTGESNGVTTFTIPSEQFTALLDMAEQYAGMLGSQVPNIDQVTALISQLKSSGISIAVDGTIQDDGATQVVTFNVLPVQGGTVGDTALFVLTLTTAENQLNLGAGQSAESGAMITLNVTSDPSTPRLDAELNAMGYGMAFRMYPSDGLQVVELTANAGDNVSMQFIYGVADGKDYLELNASASVGSFSLVFNTAKGADGVRSGVMQVETNGMQITADVAMYLADESPVGLEWPTTEKDLSELDDSVMETAMAPLTEYINSLQPAA